LEVASPYPVLFPKERDTIKVSCESWDSLEIVKVCFKGKVYFFSLRFMNYLFSTNINKSQISQNKTLARIPGLKELCGIKN
jgi:hypothetical protein